MLEIRNKTDAPEGSGTANQIFDASGNANIELYNKRLDEIREKNKRHFGECNIREDIEIKNRPSTIGQQEYAIEIDGGKNDIEIILVIERDKESGDITKEEYHVIWKPKRITMVYRESAENIPIEPTGSIFKDDINELFDDLETRKPLNKDRYNVINESDWESDYLKNLKKEEYNYKGINLGDPRILEKQRSPSIKTKLSL